MRSTTSSRRRMNSRRIFSTDSCGPRSASIPAICVNAAVQELQFVISRAMCEARSARITP